MLYEIFEDGVIRGSVDAQDADEAVLAFANSDRDSRGSRLNEYLALLTARGLAGQQCFQVPGTSSDSRPTDSYRLPFKTLAEARKSKAFAGRQVFAVNAFATLPSLEQSAEEAAARDRVLFQLVWQRDDAEKDAARLREAAERSTGLERESNIRQLREAEAEAARIRAELDRIEQQGANESAESPDPEGSTPADARQAPDTAGLVAWQAAALENWREIMEASAETRPAARFVLKWLRDNGPTDVFPRNQEKKRESIEWLDGSGNRQTLTLKSLHNRIGDWRKAGIIPA